MKGLRRAIRQRSRGQVVAEFAVLVPVLLLVFALIADGVTMVRLNSEADSAAAETARYYEANPDASNDELVEYAGSLLGGTEGVTVEVGSGVSNTEEKTIARDDGTSYRVRFRTTSNKIKVSVERDFILISTQNGSTFEVSGEFTADRHESEVA